MPAINNRLMTKGMKGKHKNVNFPKMMMMILSMIEEEEENNDKNGQVTCEQILLMINQILLMIIQILLMITQILLVIIQFLLMITMRRKRGTMTTMVRLPANKYC